MLRRSTARRCTRPIRLLNAPLTKLADTRRRQPDRAPPDAPDGAFLADSLPQILRRDLRLPASANRLKIGLVGNLRVRRPFSPNENVTSIPSRMHADGCFRSVYLAVLATAGGDARPA